MSWEAIGAVGQLLGSVGVLVTLGYLAAQVRYTRRQLESQEIAEYMREVNSAYDPIYSGRNAEIFRAGLEAPAELDANDAFVFNLLMHRQFGVIESQGFPPSTREVLRRHYHEVLLNHPGGRSWLAAHRETFSRACDLLGFAPNEDRPATP
ncbi:MAG: hypothetical protein FJ091_16550 [Deltaproteobacteria bacterium]|nr:hypothetical protein [Deltaproteobacteria bacterium]